MSEHSGGELEQLRTAVRDLLTVHAPVRAALADDPALWKRLAGEMGLTALPGADVPLSWITTVVQESGRVLTRAPLLSTLLAGILLRDVPTPGLDDGSVTAAVALDGELSQVADAVGAGLLLLADGEDLRLVTSFEATPVQTLDPTRAHGTVTVLDSGEVVGTSARARDLHWVLLAAESVGAAQALLDKTVQHLLVREQFGRPLGSFQALRHRVADLTVLVEAAASTAWFAAGSEDLTVVAPLAKAAAADAFATVAGECLQLFGGIGFTWEHDAHLYFKRAWTTALRYGTSRDLRRLAFERSGA